MARGARSNGLMTRVLTLLIGLIYAAAVLALPWFEGGVLLREQAIGVAAAAVMLALVIVGGLGHVAVSVPSLLAAALGGYFVWQAVAGQSVDAAVTLADAAKLFGAAALLSVGASVLKSSAATTAALLTTLLSAVAVAGFGLLTPEADQQALLEIEFEVLAAPFGPFVNPNNAAGFFIIGLACAATLLLRVTRGHRPNDPRGKALLAAAVLLGAIAVLGAAILKTDSRSGLAAACAAVAVTAMVGGSAGQRIVIGGLIALAAAAVVAAFAIKPWESQRWVERQEMTSDIRFTHWERMQAAVAAEPIMGWGSGTYGQVSRRFVPSERNLWFEHADNQWFELLVEGGGIGLGLAALFVIAAAVGIWRAMDEPECDVAATAAAGVLTGLALHSLFDMSILSAAIWLPAAVLVGGGSAAEPRRLGLIVAIPLLAAACWGAWELWLASEVQRAAIAVPDLNTADEAFTRELLADAEAARERHPGDALAAWTVARLQSHLGRLRMVDQPPQPLTETFGTVSWAMTEPATLHAIAVALDPERLDALRQSEAVDGPFREALEASRRAGELAPLRYHGRLLAAELAWIDSDPRDLSAALSASTMLPVHRRTQQRMTRLAWSAGDREAFPLLLQRLLRLTDAEDGRYLPQLGRDFAVAEIAESLLPADPAILLRLAQTQTDGPDDPLREALLRRTESLIDASESDAAAGYTEDERTAWAAKIVELRGDAAAAEELLQKVSGRALPQSRRALAKLLADRGEYRLAVIELLAATSQTRADATDRRNLRRWRAAREQQVEAERAARAAERQANEETDNKETDHKGNGEGDDATRGDGDAGDDPTALGTRDSARPRE